jgi:hypothetical protein
VRPSVEEQLLGTCRVLEKVVSPCVTDPFARTILQGLVDNLRMLTGALPAIPRFLRDDNAATLTLLGALAGAATPALAARIALATGEPRQDDADAMALEERNGALRALLAEAVCSENLGQEHHHAIVQYMSERAAQAPMRYVATAVPAPANQKT